MSAERAAPDPGQTDAGHRAPALLGLALVVALGTAIRAYGVLSADFPLNDGGLFHRMVLDLQASWPALPETTTYNGIAVPFAYPPLAFYLGAALEPLLGLGILRAVPLVAAILTVPAFWLLARSILGPGLTALAATATFAIIPRSFEWMTMGGGLTRAPGLLLAITALWLTHRVLRGAGRGTVVAAGVAGGLVVLTHPQAALFTLLSGLFLIAWLARDRAVIARLGAAAGIAAAIAAPWLVTLVARDGAAGLLSASGTQPGPFIGLLSLLNFSLTGSRLFDVVGLLSAVGLLLAIVRGRWFVPAWLAVVMVLDSRGGATYAAVPASLLAGQAFVDLIVRPFWRPASPRPPTSPHAPAAPRPSSGRLPRLDPGRTFIGAVLVVVAVIDAFGSQIAPSWAGTALGAEQRAAIEAAGEAAPDGEFLVVTGRYWPVDAAAEWFPVLAGARSVATVQGHEWRGTAEFDRRTDAAAALRLCANADERCLDEWSEAWEIGFSHVFVPKGSLQGPAGDPECCTGLRHLLGASDRYRVVSDGPGGTTFERLDGAAR